MNGFAIAIDGPAGAGKSSVARAVARTLNATYLDTGAMYRAVGLYMMKNGVPLDMPALIAAHADDAHVDVRYENGVQHIDLNGEDVSDAIRENAVSAAASAVSAVPRVRELMVARQREIAAKTDVVMDGRDIGTRVLPAAPLKIFLTARAEVRAQRRYLELEGRGEKVDLDTLLAEIKQRDYNDAHRAVSPMVPAADAILLDSSDMTEAEVISHVVALARERMGR
ncbi:MAG: (d)CMP kinase [Clostridiales bacterium]|nr:(d)CMP kinase [Clostridiales bacterium]